MSTIDLTGDAWERDVIESSERNHQGLVEFTANSLPDPATLGVGATVVVDGVVVTKNASRLVRESKRSLPHIVSSRNLVPEILTTMSTATARGYQVWRDFTANCDVDGIDLTFANFYMANTGVETNNASTVTIKVSVYKQGDAFVTPVFFNGARTYAMTAGEIVTSDKIPVSLKHGVDTGIFVRVWVSVATTSDTICTSFIQNTKAFPTTTDQWSTYRSVNVANTFTDDITTNWTKDLGQNEFAPVLVRGWSVDGGAIPSVVVVGSSSAQGVGDAQQAPYYVPGYLARSLCAAKIPYINCSETGETAANFLGDGAAKRRKLISLCNATHSINTYGSNDVGAGATYADVVTRLQRIEKVLRGFGTEPYFCTYTPGTSSTDSWATVANQTVQSPIRHQLSDWLRDLSGFNVIDLEAVSDSGLASDSMYTGKWRIDLGQPTTDGLHGAAVMHTAIAASITYPSIKF